MRTKLIHAVALASLAGLLAAGCDVYVRPPAAGVVVTAPGEVVVASAPPVAPPYVEVAPMAPGPEFVWIGGAWIWGGGRWEWERGRWERRPRPGAVWMAHHYEYRNGHHVFIRGGWR